MNSAISRPEMTSPHRSQPLETEHAADAAAMLELGRRLAAELSPGEIVALDGELGAGKTQLAKGIAEGLGSLDVVTSPTFPLANEYRSGPLAMIHLDFYRLESAGEALRIGWDDYLDEEAVVVVEWASKFPELFPPERTRRYLLEHAPGGGRRLTRR